MKDYPTYASIWVLAYITCLSHEDSVLYPQTAKTVADRAVKDFQEREMSGAFEQ